ncbi:MAG: 4Fe-4S binding protein [Saprospiraceae bacterium]|nr:4Fe-4S binding protein [Saprospiraceae bacterium]
MKSPVIFQIGWNACINCGACVAVCPQPAGFTSDFDTIAVNRPCDIACMVCEDICPVSTITHFNASLRENGDLAAFIPKFINHEKTLNP